MCYFPRRVNVYRARAYNIISRQKSDHVLYGGGPPSHSVVEMELLSFWRFVRGTYYGTLIGLLSEFRTDLFCQLSKGRLV